MPVRPGFPPRGLGGSKWPDRSDPLPVIESLPKSLRPREEDAVTMNPTLPEPRRVVLADWYGGDPAGWDGLAGDLLGGPVLEVEVDGAQTLNPVKPPLPGKLPGGRFGGKAVVDEALTPEAPVPACEGHRNRGLQEASVGDQFLEDLCRAAKLGGSMCPRNSRCVPARTGLLATPETRSR